MGVARLKPDIEDRPIATEVRDRIAVGAAGAAGPSPTRSPDAASTGLLTVLAWLGFCGLAACDGRLVPPAAAQGVAGPARPSEEAYRRPPVLAVARNQGDGRVRLDGWAEPGARVRLASPRGDAVLADADRRGAWRLWLATPRAPQLFGLSMIENGRTVQSEGYIAVMPDGKAAQLRAGAGAVALAGDGSPAILAVDFDSKGGAVVSGRAPPRSALEVWVDGARLARGDVSTGGRFSAALDQPLSFTDHRLDIRDGPVHADAVVRLERPAPLPGGPYRATATPAGWRIDWMTPGGGLQTTLLLNQERSLPADRGTP